MWRLWREARDPVGGCVVVDVWLEKLTLEYKGYNKNPEEKWMDLIA
jgi:hypothetical protein